MPLNPNILPQIAGGASTTGVMGMGAVAELQKALTAGYGTELSALEGAAALRIDHGDSLAEFPGDRQRGERLAAAARPDEGQAELTLLSASWLEEAHGRLPRRAEPTRLSRPGPGVSGRAWVRRGGARLVGW